MPPKCETHNEFWSRQRDGQMICVYCLTEWKTEHRKRKVIAPKGQHTPGPWTLVNLSDGKYGHVDQLVAGGRAIICLQHDGSDEGKKNGRLIAAAPDLLAASQRYIEARHGQDGREFIEAEQELDAAIRKAKGEI